MAAGFTVAEDRIGDFREFLSDHISRQTSGEVMGPEIGIDGALSPEGATVELIEALEAAGPYGSGNPRPRFVLPAVTSLNASVVGTEHVRCFLMSAEGGPRIKAIAFRAVGTAAGDALLNSRGVALHVAGHLNIDTWQGNRHAQLVIEDVVRAA